MYIQISNNRCVLVLIGKFRCKTMLTRKSTLWRKYWTEHYEIWHECTYIYSNETVEIRLCIAVFVVLIWGGQVDNSHPEGDVLQNLIQSPYNKLYSIIYVYYEHNCIFFTSRITCLHNEILQFQVLMRVKPVIVISQVTVKQLARFFH